MMAGMDDKEDPDDDITTEAMSGLSRILCEIEESHIRAILINVSLKIRPCFEKVILPICCSVYLQINHQCLYFVEKKNLFRNSLFAQGF